jgi:hypothetical protein
MELLKNYHLIKQNQDINFYQFFNRYISVKHYYRFIFMYQLNSLIIFLAHQVQNQIKNFKAH